MVQQGPRRSKIPWWKRKYVVNREMQSKYAWSGVIIGITSSGLSAGMLLWSFYAFNIWQGQRLPLPVVVVIVSVLFVNAFSIYVATVLSTQRIAGPLFNLLKQFSSLEKGDFRTRANFRKQDELHYVGRRFNEMAASLESRERQFATDLSSVLELLKSGDSASAQELLLEVHQKLGIGSAGGSNAVG